jgi:hypothetical protein
MRNTLLSILCVAGFGAVDGYAFEARTVVSAQLTERETQRYERFRKMPGVRDVKMVAVDEQVLSRSTLPVDLAGARVEFKVTRSKSDALWKGRSGKNFDRFVVRNINGLYSGHLLVDGRLYVMTPIKKGVSVLYEMKANLECGVGALKVGQK